MSTSDFYRRQATDLLRQAEMAEAIEKVSELPGGSVITFVKDSYTYAALAVSIGRQLGEPLVRWYFTGTTRRASYTTSDFINWLVSYRVTDIKVWMDAVPLEDWPAKDVVVNVEPTVDVEAELGIQ